MPNLSNPSVIPNKPNTCAIYAFPDITDIAAAWAAVDVLARSGRGSTRKTMLRTLRAILDKYGLKRLTLPECTVEAAPEPGWAAVRARRFVAGRHCPGCGADIYRWPGPVKILGIVEGHKVDTVSYGCSCGAVFAKREPV